MASIPNQAVRQADGSSDRRWIVLMPDGSYRTLGRARDPTDSEVRRAEADLEARGIGGWLAVQSHSFHKDPFPTFMMVHHIGVPRGTFEEALGALRASMEGGSGRADS